MADRKKDTVDAYNANGVLNSFPTYEQWLSGETKKKTVITFADNTHALHDDTSVAKETAYDGFEKGVQRAYYNQLGDKMMRKTMGKSPILNIL